VIDRFALVSGAWSPSLAPDGARVAFVGDRTGLPRLMVAPMDHPGDYAPGGVAVPVSPPEQEVVSVAWSPDGEWLAYLVSPAGTIRSELHAVRPDGRDAHLVAGGGGTETVFAGLWTGEPDRYAFTIADGPTAKVFDVDVTDGTPRELAADGFLLVTGYAGNALLARRGERGRRHVVLFDRELFDLNENTAYRLGDGVDGEDGRFAPDGTRAFLRSSAGGEFTALAAVPLTGGAPGELTVVAARDGADLDSYALLPDGERALCVWNVHGRSRLEVVDLADGRAIRELRLPGDVVSGWSVRADGTGLVVALSGPRLPRTLWTGSFDGELAPLIGPTPEEAAVVAEAVVAVRRTFTARDGLELDGWLYRPADAGGPGPAVVVFHGGPEAQDRPDWSPVAQTLVAAGLTVFAPNVRGSTGYGRTFMGLDDGPNRPAAVDDARAAASFLVEAGYAAPGRIGAHGWSYGGYLTLVALERWPELFTAGCAAAGMSDLRTFLAGTEPWMAAVSGLEYGDPVADAELLADLSPMSRVGRITAPTLLVHGERDTNVPVRESVQLHEALLAAGVPTELIVLKGEGHAVVGAPNRAMLADKVTGWFRRWL
jgi:dipeptidyl aminopeptidase/acylaminoacyl peptidase